MVPSAGTHSSAPFTAACLLKSLALFHSVQNGKYNDNIRETVSYSLQQVNLGHSEGIAKCLPGFSVSASSIPPSR